MNKILYEKIFSSPEDDAIVSISVLLILWCMFQVMEMSDVMHWITWMSLVAVVNVIVASADVSDCPAPCRCVLKEEEILTACTGHNLSSIPEGIPNNTEALYLKDNIFTVLHQNSFASLPNLKTLVLTHCNIETIESNAFAGLSNLGSLDLRWNNIQELQSHTFSGLFHLKRLELDNNDIQAIHNFAFHGLNLTRLSIEGNGKLAEIAQKAFHQARINDISIHNATLSSQSMHSLRPLFPSLRELSWRYNQKPLEIPEDLFDGFTFRTLNLNGNKIRDVSFLRYVITDDLSLDDNPIGIVDFSRYPNLRQVRNLRLAKTNFHHIRLSDFNGMPYLRQLYIQNNGITTLSEELEPMFDGLQRLVMDNNPFHCNCEMLWLKQWIPTASAVVQGGKCATPYPDDIVLIPEEAFTCTAPSTLDIKQSVNMTNGKEISLRCTARGDPPPTITWYSPDGNLLATSFSTNRSVLANSGELTLKSSSKGDSGTYRCMADNLKGNISDVVHVDVYKILNIAGDNGNSGTNSASSVIPYVSLLAVMLKIVFLLFVYS